MATLTQRSPGTTASPPAWDPATLLAAALLIAFVLVAYGSALFVPFINDDYIFLDKTRSASFASLWAPRALAFHWYRPWARELHYWALQHAFGARELPFHVASFAIALGVLLGYGALARRLAGRATAAVAVAGVAALAAWGVPMVWIAGVQDLWMLAFAVIFLHAVARGSRTGATVALALGLLSKETAAVLPALALAFRILVARDTPRAAVRWVVPLLVVVAAWAAFHPVLGGRWWWYRMGEPPQPGLHPPLLEVAGRTALVPLNLDALPDPEHGWGAALAASALGAILLVALVLTAARGAPTAPARSGTVSFGLAWAGIGWLPLLMPTLGWHAYYALLGALGAWLAIAPLLARRPEIAVAVVMALALLRGARAETPSRDWGSEAYQRRAGAFIGFLRHDLERQVPDPPPHSRFYFVRVPSNVGFLAGDGPALRVWYGDSTLRGGFYPSYRPRAAGEPRGPDWFFRYDSTTGWVRVHPGPEDVAAARQSNPRWITDHEMLAQTLAGGGDWGSAAAEYEKLAGADSSRVDFAYNAGVCDEALGDSSDAARWYARAAALPGADSEARETARRFARHLNGGGRNERR